VAAVWQAILNGGAECLGDAIMGFQLTPESARSAIAQADESLEARAFAMIIKNRVNRGDILANGASLSRIWAWATVQRWLAFLGSRR
jgi:DNA adenine methylase